MKYQEIEDIIIDEINDAQVDWLFDKMVELVNGRAITKWAVMRTCTIIIGIVLKTTENPEKVHKELHGILLETMKRMDEKPS